MRLPLQKTSLAISDEEERLLALISQREHWDPALGEPSSLSFTERMTEASLVVCKLLAISIEILLKSWNRAK